MMKQFDIFIVFVSWGEGGKNRPVLVLSIYGEFVKIYQITTKYDNKSCQIRSKYYEITDWKQAGLERPSYVDTNDTFDLPKSTIIGKKPIGRLSETDKQRLLDFLIGFFP